MSVKYDKNSGKKSILISEDLHKELKKYASMVDVPLYLIIERVLSDYLEGKKLKKKK